MNIHIRVQHVEGRVAPLARLLERLPAGAEVITDREGGNPNPMRNYLRCLENPPKDASHLCVIQDDALPCRGFETLLEEAVGERPDEVVSLFVGGLPGRTKKDFLNALARGDRWSPIFFREIHHVVALVWPVALAKEFLDWYPTTRIPGPIPPRSDDATVGYWIKSTYANRHKRRVVWAHVPCLVEHPDDFPSTIRATARFGDTGRRAVAFIDDL